MTCPLCGADGATVSTEEYDLRVLCTACGAFRISKPAAEQWARLTDDRLRYAREYARRFLAERHRFTEIPKIEVRDAWAWGATT